MSKPKLGSGKRFQNIVDELKKEGKSDESARKIAASIGHEKYGTKKMTSMAKKGRK
ncbi:MAG TPA: hypothetical protein VLD66_00035 [Methyloceanibacter sp.]|nr:hypothetical protein [Methyloceanibacter sp.]